LPAKVSIIKTSKLFLLSAKKRLNLWEQKDKKKTCKSQTENKLIDTLEKEKIKIIMKNVKNGSKTKLK